MSVHNKYLLKSPHTASRVIDGEAVIIIPQDNEVKVLNRVGSRIWELLNGRRDLREVLSVVSDEFDVSREIIEKDTTEFIKDLHEKDLIMLLDTPENGKEESIDAC